jgi:hypothetical protein
MALELLSRPIDTLLMVDNDMIQHGWRSLQILDTPDYDIAGCLQYAWFPRDYQENRPPHAWPCVFTRKPEGEKGMQAVYPQPGENYREVDRVGSGFMAIKRRVLADERMLLAPGFDPPAMWRNVYEPNFVRAKGLDMDFCDRAKANGHRVVVNWRAEIGHNKTVNLNEVDEYAKAQAIQGFEMGVQHGLSMAEGRGGAEDGRNGNNGPERPGHEEVEGDGLDRADRAAQEVAAGL